MKATTRMRARATLRSQQFRSNRVWLITAGMLLVSAVVLVSSLSNRIFIGSDDAIMIVRQPPAEEIAQEQHGIQPLDDVSEAVAAVAFPNRLRGAVNGSGLNELSSVLMSSTQPLKLRRQAAWRIAKIGSAEAVAVLQKVLLQAPPILQATITEALGQSGHASSKTVLEAVIGNSSDESVTRAAVRGLAAVPGGAAVSTLVQLLGDASQSESIRAEAALALGGLGLAGDAVPTLVDTALYSESPILRSQRSLLWEAGRFPKPATFSGS